MISVLDKPISWTGQPIWSMFTRVKRVGHSEEELLSVYRDYGVIPKSSRDDNHNVASEDLSAYQLVEPGDLVVNKMKAWQGSFAISEFRGIVSPAYFVYKPHHQANSRFLHYLLRSAPYMAHYNRISSGVRIGQWDLDPAQFRLTEVLLPPLDEQKAIADFLDRELAQIDGLIDKQGQLQELLKTERATYISTKVFGQNADVTICELPELPNGWAQMKLKQVASIQASNVDKKMYEDGYPVSLCNYVDVYKNETIHAGIDFMQATATAAEIAKFSLRSGQVILTKDSESANDIGVGAFVPDDLPGVVCGYHLSMLTPYAFMDGQFLKYVLDSKPAKSHFARYSNGLTRMALGQAALGALPVPVPPLAKQQALVLEMRSALEAIDTAIRNGNTLISILRERRQSLISAAVTGKIDVRKVA